MTRGRGREMNQTLLRATPLHAPNIFKSSFETAVEERRLENLMTSGT